MRSTHFRINKLFFFILNTLLICISINNHMVDGNVIKFENNKEKYRYSISLFFILFILFHVYLLKVTRNAILTKADFYGVLGYINKSRLDVYLNTIVYAYCFFFYLRIGFYSLSLLVILLFTAVHFYAEKYSLVS